MKNGGTYSEGPVHPSLTEFEKEAERLGLRSREEFVLSVELRRWCEHNQDRVYVPEWLLDKWGIAA